MTSLREWESIIIVLDHEPGKVLVIHGDNETLTKEIPIDKGGNITIYRNMFGDKSILPINLFEKEVTSLLSFEQEITLYDTWGTNLSIMISGTANVLGVDKRVAKEIITLGERHGILYRGNNYVWKVKEKLIKDRWITKADRMKSGPKVQESLQESVKRIKEKFGMGEDHGVEHVDGEEIDDTVKLSKDISDAKSNIARIVNKVKGKVTSIAGNNNNNNIPLEEQSEEQLRKRISYLQERLSNNKIWTELETPWMLNDEIHRIKAQLRYFDNKRSSQTYMNEANALNLPSSITEVPIDDEIQGSQIPSIGTPRTKASQKTLKKKPAR